MSLHSAKGSGGQKDNTNAVRHGFWSRRVLPHERAAFAEVSGAIDLTDEIKLQRILIARVLRSWNRMGKGERALVLEELVTGEGARRVRKRPDHVWHLTRMMRTLTHLVQAQIAGGYPENDPERHSQLVRQFLNMTEEIFDNVPSDAVNGHANKL